jgi:hypothetical protein
MSALKAERARGPRALEDAMKALLALTIVLATGLALAAPAVTADEGCSVQDIAGRWVFATGVGQLPALGGDITAIGTMNIDAEGNLDGRFDVTVATVRFLPGVPYSGSVVVNDDCTGTLRFVTGAGTVRTDSIVVLGREDMWGMSQNPANLWTYTVRRISSRPPEAR